MLISSIMGNIGMMNDSAFRVQASNSALMGLTSFAGRATDLNALHRTEKYLLIDRLNSEMMYKMSEAQLASLKKLEKENIQRTFSTFA